MTRTRSVLGVYPGSFDPVTLGHEDIARRTLRVADRVLVAVAHQATQAKSPAFEMEERLEMLREVFQDETRIECVSFSGLLVDFCREVRADFVIRGLRAVSDFEYEFQMAQMNRQMDPGMEFLFLTPDAHLSFLSASLVREVARLGGDVSPFVSKPVLRRMEARFGHTEGAASRGEGA
ncbi:MAG: pantetheine-phosphate adenylyltransferase [Gemmatimonadales bacterium]|nr:MAG: pantetheine-phosphate adenylyltransferase [Gemmatimonadales bacterium]